MEDKDRGYRVVQNHFLFRNGSVPEFYNSVIHSPEVPEIIDGAGEGSIFQSLLPKKRCFPEEGYKDTITNPSNPIVFVIRRRHNIILKVGILGRYLGDFILRVRVWKDGGEFSMTELS